jgi:hypothetical protein
MTVAATTSISQDAVFAGLGDFIDYLGLVNANAEGGTTPVLTIRLPVNRAALPPAAFIAMSPLGQARLSTNRRIYTPNPATGSPNVAVQMNTRHEIQIDCYGGAAASWANMLVALLRDATTVDWFAANAPGVVPLYADDARQMPLVDGEDQYEERWTFSAFLQTDPTVTLAQQFAKTLGPVKIVDVT